jgi:hypothetical protein
MFWIVVGGGGDGDLARSGEEVRGVLLVPGAGRLLTLPARGQTGKQEPSINDRPAARTGAILKMAEYFLWQYNVYDYYNVDK